MKSLFTVFLLTWINVMVTWSQSGLLDQRVRIRHSQGTISSLLEEIGDRGGFSFSYRQEIPSDRTINLSNTNQTVREYLDELFPRGIYCIQFENKLLLMQKEVVFVEYTLKGKVIDRETGEPIPGVTVYIPGSKPLVGSASDEEGNFEINLPPGASTVQLSCIGYQSRSVSPAQTGEYAIELNPDREELDEVIIAYYKKPKDENLNAAISSISAEQLDRLQIPNIENVIQGNVSGVHVVSNSGMPGASLQMKVRGISSLINSDPVYYLNDFPIQESFLYALSPRDIGSIEVLKDGTSLAGYGARAGNGVILLETKKGQPDKTRFYFDMYTGIQERWRKLELMNTEDKRKYEHLLMPFEDTLAIDTCPYDTDWQDLIFHPAGTGEYHFAASGGNERSDFYFSSGYFRQESIVKNISFERYSFGINSNFRKQRRIQFGQDLLFSYLHFTGLKEGCFMNDYNNYVLGAMIMPSTKNPDDNDPLRLSHYIVVQNPLNDAMIGHNQRKNYLLLNSLKGDAEILSNLHYISRLGLNLCFQDNTSNTNPPPFAFENLNVEEYSYHILDLSFNWQQSLKYTAHIDKNYTLDAVIDFIVGRNKSEWVPLQYKGYDQQMHMLDDPDNTEQDLFAGLGKTIDFRHTAYSASLAFSRKDKLHLTGEVRREETGFYDHFHNFTQCAQYFPWVSLGWDFSRENFLRDNPVLSYGKLRYSWGIAGNSPGVDYTYFARIMRDIEYVYAFCNETEYIISANNAGYINYTAKIRRANVNYYRENLQKHNLGVDLGFFRDRLFLSADYFLSELKKGKIYGLEMPRKIMEKLSELDHYGIVPPSLSNMQNKGFELELNYRQSSSNLKWNIRMNFSHLRNKILAVNESEQLARDDTGTESMSVNIPGETAGSFYGYRIEGLFRHDDCDSLGRAVNQPYITSNGIRKYAQPYAIEGDYKFADINRDSVIDENDRVVLGNPLPDFIFSLSGQLEWKNFDLSVMIQGTWGNEIFNATKMYLYNPYGNSNLAKDAANSYRRRRVTPNGEEIDPGFFDTELARMSSSINYNLRASDFYVEDGSYLRLKNLQLGYSFQPEFVHRIRLRTFRIFISLQNLLTITSYSGLDPEVGGWGIDCGTYPQPRVYLLGANLEF